MIRQQTLALVKHPLFVDITACHTPARLTNSRNMGLSWRAGEPIKIDTPKGASVAEDAPFVVSNGGASIGNVSNRLQDSLCKLTNVSERPFGSVYVSDIR